MADAEGVRIKVLIGITGRMVKRGLKLDTSAVVELCDSAVVLVMNVERERDIGGSSAERVVSTSGPSHGESPFWLRSPCLICSVREGECRQRPILVPF